VQAHYTGRHVLRFRLQVGKGLRQIVLDLSGGQPPRTERRSQSACKCLMAANAHLSSLSVNFILRAITALCSRYHAPGALGPLGTLAFTPAGRGPVVNRRLRSSSTGQSSPRNAALPRNPVSAVADGPSWRTGHSRRAFQSASLDHSILRIRTWPPLEGSAATLVESSAASANFLQVRPVIGDRLLGCRQKSRDP
jgi:hypothetical protein